MELNRLSEAIRRCPRLKKVKINISCQILSPEIFTKGMKKLSETNCEFDFNFMKNCYIQSQLSLIAKNLLNFDNLNKIKFKIISQSSKFISEITNFLELLKKCKIPNLYLLFSHSCISSKILYDFIRQSQFQTLQLFRYFSFPEGMMNYLRPNSSIATVFISYSKKKFIPKRPISIFRSEKFTVDDYFDTE